MHPIARRIVLAFLALAIACGPRAAQAEPLTIFAAASLKNALDAVIGAWKDSKKGDVAVSYASSSTLAKQIEQGAPADIFISADTQWMDYLTQRKLAHDPRNLLGNQLVLIAPKEHGEKIDIRPNFNLASLLGTGRLALGDPSNVPAGIYAKEALQKLGAWTGVEAKLAPAPDVRAAMALVSRGEAPYGIVYKTDAMVDPGVQIVGVFPDDSHAAIVYPVAVVAASRQVDAANGFSTFLFGPDAKAIFERFGFSVLPR